MYRFPDILYTKIYRLCSNNIIQTGRYLEKVKIFEMAVHDVKLPLGISASFEQNTVVFQFFARLKSEDIQTGLIYYYYNNNRAFHIILF